MAVYEYNGTARSYFDTATNLMHFQFWDSASATWVDELVMNMVTGVSSIIGTFTFTDIILTSETLPTGSAGQVAYDGTDLQFYGTAWINLTSDISTNTTNISTNTTDIASNLSLINTPNSLFVKSAVPTAGISSAYGTAVIEAAPTNKGIVPLSIDMVIGGTVGTETLIIQVEVTFSDTLTAIVTHSFTALGTYQLTTAEIESLLKDGVYITQIAVASQTSATSTTATTTANIYALSV